MPRSLERDAHPNLSRNMMVAACKLARYFRRDIHLAGHMLSMVSAIAYATVRA